MPVNLLGDELLDAQVQRAIMAASVGTDAREECIAVASSVETSTATGIDGDESNNALPNSGAVYLFGRDGSGDLSQLAYIKASNTGMGDYFGVALALSGNHLAVGAFGERSNATGIDGDQANDDAPSAGAVYVRRLAP